MYRQISPAELETVLLRHPDVIDAVVVAVKDEHVGDLPRALVVVRRPDVDTGDIVAFVNGWSSVLSVLKLRTIKLTSCTRQRWKVVFTRRIFTEEMRYHNKNMIMRHIACVS